MRPRLAPAGQHTTVVIITKLVPQLPALFALQPSSGLCLYSLSATRQVNKPIDDNPCNQKNRKKI